MSEQKKNKCPNCGTESDTDFCAKCGKKFYVPMDEEKQRKIRFIGGVIAFAVLIVILMVRAMTK